MTAVVLLLAAVLYLAVFAGGVLLGRRFGPTAEQATAAYNRGAAAAGMGLAAARFDLASDTQVQLVTRRIAATHESTHEVIR